MTFNLVVLYEDNTWETVKLDSPSVEEAEELAKPIILATGQPISMYFFTPDEETPNVELHES